MVSSDQFYNFMIIIMHMYQLHWVLIFVWGLSWKLDLEEGPRQHKEIFQNLPTNCMRWCFHLELNFTTTITKNSHTTTVIYLFRYSCIAWTVFFFNLFVLFCEILTAKIQELLFTLFYSLFTQSVSGTGSLKLLWYSIFNSFF